MTDAGIVHMYCKWCMEITPQAEALPVKMTRKQKRAAANGQKPLKMVNAKWLCTVCGTISTGQSAK